MSWSLNSAIGLFDEASSIPTTASKAVGQSLAITFAVSAGSDDAVFAGSGAFSAGLSIGAGSDLDESGGTIPSGTSGSLILACDAAGEYIIGICGTTLTLTVNDAAAPAIRRRADCIGDIVSMPI